jgi:hypothetical protein
VPLGGVDARVVHDNVEPCEGLHRLVDNPLGVVDQRHVTHDAKGPSAGRFDVEAGGVDARDVAAAHGDGGALGRELERDRPADAARRSRHQRPLPVKCPHARLPLFVC